MWLGGPDELLGPIHTTVLNTELLLHVTEEARRVLIANRDALERLANELDAWTYLDAALLERSAPSQCDRARGRSRISSYETSYRLAAQWLELASHSRGARGTPDRCRRRRATIVAQLVVLGHKFTYVAVTMFS